MNNFLDKEKIEENGSISPRIVVISLSANIPAFVVLFRTGKQSIVDRRP